MNTNKIKKSLTQNYNIQILNNASFHVFEIPFKYLKPYQLKIMYNYLKRHQDIFPPKIYQ